MRKFLLLILMLFLVTGCTFSEDKKMNDTTDDNKEETTDVLPPEPIYVDENPVVVGLYQNGKLVRNISATFYDNIDIDSFDVYFTNDENVGDTNTKRNFNKYASNYDNVSQYKIGFYVSFDVADKKMEATILNPEAMYSLAPYVYNYLYDDVHQADGTWYSHVETKDVKNDTIYSSIKLYGADSMNKVTSPITLMVFTYDTDDDFDENGIYRGNSKYTITINKM